MQTIFFAIFRIEWVGYAIQIAVLKVATGEPFESLLK